MGQQPAPAPFSLRRWLRNLPPFRPQPPKKIGGLVADGAATIAQPTALEPPWYRKREEQQKLAFTLFTLMIALASAATLVLWPTEAARVTFLIAVPGAIAVTLWFVLHIRKVKPWVPSLVCLVVCLVLTAVLLYRPTSQVEANAKAQAEPIALLYDKAFYKLGTAADSRGQLIVIIPVRNLTNTPISYAAYGVAIAKPIAKNDADEVAVFRELKRQAERLAKIGGGGISTLDAVSSGEPGVAIPGPYLSNTEWDNIQVGREYVYWYVLFAPTSGGKDFSKCGLFDGHQQLSCFLDTD